MQITHHSFFFFFNDTATTEIYTLSLHDALPISASGKNGTSATTCAPDARGTRSSAWAGRRSSRRSEEHTSELQSQSNLVCRLLLEKKKKKKDAAAEGLYANHTRYSMLCVRIRMY